MDGNCHVVSDAENSTKCVGTQAEMSMLTHKLKALSFLLHWVIVRTSAKYLYFGCLDFTCLAFTGTLHEYTIHTETSACGDEFEHFLIEFLYISNNLHVLNDGTIIECYEVYGF